MPLPVVQGSWSASGNALYGTINDEAGRTLGHRFSLHGGGQEVTKSRTFQPVTHFQEHSERGVLFFEHTDQQLHGSGSRIKTYDLATSEIEVYRQRPGGAFNPALSPDGRLLVYGHRDDQETVVVLHDLETRSERILVRGLDRDHQESPTFYYGMAPNMAWHPDGTEIFLAVGGRIRAVSVASGAMRDVPFRAPVDRQLDSTIRFPVSFSEGETRAASYRWAHRTSAGVVFESLGDIWMKQGDDLRNLTNSSSHETSPVVDDARGVVYYASWTDDEMGKLYRRPLRGGAATMVASYPSQIGSLALSEDGTLAFVRGTGQLVDGARLEFESKFELVTIDGNGTERQVTEVAGSTNGQSRLPLTVRFGPDGDWIYYTELPSDTLTLRRIRPDGTRKTTLYRFPEGDRAVLSPDLEWIAFREYHRSFVTPFEWIGKPVTIAAYKGAGFTKRIDESDGPYLAWSDNNTVSWSRGGMLYEKALADVLSGEGEPTTTDIEVTYEVATTETTIALTHVRVITMDQDRGVIEDATIVVEDNRISAVGTDVNIPSDARVFDLSGHTVMPGMVDAHAHPDPGLSQSNVIEQRLPGISAGLAHGVTTLYELYGTEEKDPWVRDMIQAGRMIGPRLYSVGAPMYGLRDFRPKTHRPIDSYADAEQHVLYSRDQGILALKDYVNFTRIDRHQLASAAREHGLNVVAETASNAIMNFTQIVDGSTGLEHSMGVTPLYQDVIELFRASEIGVTPTLIVVYNGPQGQSFFDQSSRVWEDPKLLRFSRAEDLRRFRRVPHYWDDDLYAPAMAGAMKKLFDAGVLINAGGHGQMLGLDMHWELELLVQGGFSPMDAIQVATRNGAVYHGLGADLGSIEVGKLADLVVMSANPLNDIRNTREIRYVIKDGVVYSGDDAGRVYPDPQEAARFYFQRGR